MKNESTLVKNVLEDNGFSLSKDNDWTISWSCSSIKYEVFKKFKSDFLIIRSILKDQSFSEHNGINKKRCNV